MRTPLILRPVVPVLNDIVDGYLTLAELSQRALHLLRGLIALTTLPEAQHPLGIERCLTGECAIAGDDLIEVLASNEVIVHILGHLAPNGELSALLSTAGLCHSQTTIALAAIGLPLDAQLDSLVLLELDRKLIGIRIPGRAPTLGHHLLAVDIDLDIAGIVKNELEKRRALGLDEALVGDIGPSQLEALRQILDTTIVGLQRNGRLSWRTIFI